MVITVLQILVLFATIGVGVLAFASPLTAASFTGLGLPGPRGRTEIRAILGGVFIGLGAAPLILPGQAAFQTVAITYLVLAASRLVGIVIDSSADRSNWIDEKLVGFLAVASGGVRFLVA